MRLCLFFYINRWLRIEGYVTLTLNAGIFVPKTIRSLEHSFPWWNFRSRDHSFTGTFVPGTIRSLDHSFPRPNITRKIHSLDYKSHSIMLSVPQGYNLRSLHVVGHAQQSGITRATSTTDAILARHTCIHTMRIR